MFGRARTAGALAGLALLVAACSSSPSAAPPATTTTVPPRPVVVVRPTAAQAAACAADPASWMGCMVRDQPRFGDTPLSQVSLPGAMNAATDTLDPQAFDTQSGACSLYAPGMASQGALIDRWVAAQDESLGEQLDQGVRYLDLQVAYNGIPSPHFDDWRVVNTLYSEYPLFVYLDQIAAWAQVHPHEVVVVDVRAVCQGTGATAAVRRDLWGSFDHLPLSGDGPTLADVAYDAAAAPGRGLAATTIDQVVGQRGGGHNVVVVVPATTPDRAAASAARLHPFYSVPPSGGGVPAPPAVTVARAEAGLAPGAAGGQPDFAAVNHTLLTELTRSVPPPGALAGRGLATVSLTYQLAGASAAGRQTLFAAYGGLVTPAEPPAGTPPAWEAGLWSPAFTRNDVVAALGHRVNVALSDGVEYQGFVPAVITLNGG